MDIKEQYLQSIYHWYPEFMVQNVELVAHGQNNDILIINDEFIFRFPSRSDLTHCYTSTC
ncbi:hypothetical protein KDK_65700 [Dictyobacter kobayashii]|uniref:Aminoglycoside phosphotransferase domain-containing protein n=1 Tax=Dictyobacter kobayashii TaxID=2014872 RepID=A0A402AUH1_9CHLR|nr:hypothetical protein KDK_65700 [Dictyobacter kobayashii]